MYTARPPAILRLLLPGRLWRMPTTRKVLYLTFDDGPIPEVTPWVLDQLRAYNARGTFFVVGDNAQRHPTLLARIRTEGHAVGNHTWHHLKGTRSAHSTYLRDVLRAQVLTGTRLFRPPYGRMTRSQVKALAPRFDIVMWDVLSADFDTTVSPEQCLRNTISNARPGSIIVFHDSLKAEARLRHALPHALAHFAQAGYTFEALPEDGLTALRK